MIAQDLDIEVKGKSTRDKLKEMGLLPDPANASTNKDENSFDMTLEEFEANIDDDAFNTSDEEDEFDRLKGKNLFDDPVNTRKNDEGYQRVANEII